MDRQRITEVLAELKAELKASDEFTVSTTDKIDQLRREVGVSKAYGAMLANTIQGLEHVIAGTQPAPIPF